MCVMATRVRLPLDWAGDEPELEGLVRHALRMTPAAECAEVVAGSDVAYLDKTLAELHPDGVQYVGAVVRA